MLSILFYTLSLVKRVKDILHKAFWDCLEAELNEDPPEYDYAIKLLEEIRDVGHTFILQYNGNMANAMRFIDHSIFSYHQRPCCPSSTRVLTACALRSWRFWTWT